MAMKNIMLWLKHFFIPHEGNDHQPHSLRRPAVMFMLLAVIVAELLALTSFFPVTQKQLDYFAAVLPSVLVDATNETRSEFSLGELTINDKLVAAAQLKADDMAERGYFAHQTPEGLQPWYFLDQVGYPYAAAGENLAVNFSDSYEAHNAWLDSPGHRANILQNQFTEIGIATARGKYKGRSTVFVVQFFGRPTVASATQVAQTPTPSPTPVQVTPTPTPVVARAPAPTPEPEPAQQEENVLGEEVLAAEETSAPTPVVVQASAPAPTPTPTQTSASAQTQTPEPVLAQASIEIETENEQPAPVSQPDSQQTPDEEPESTVTERVLTSPSTIATYVLITIGAIVFLSLIFKIFFHIKKQYVVLILQGLVLLLLIVLFYLFNDKLASVIGIVG